MHDSNYLIERNNINKNLCVLYKKFYLEFFNMIDLKD